MSSVYVLKLKGGNYYVGKSTDAIARYQEHLEGKGSSWTNRYEPVNLEEIIENCDSFDEDKYVKKYMAKYGIDKVRGGSYSSIQLPQDQTRSLKREIWGAQDKCLKCGSSGHWAQTCRVSQQTNYQKRYYSSESDDEEDDEESDEDD